MMGIISSELECCWSEMGFHLLKSCRLYTLSLQEFWHRYATHGIFVFELFSAVKMPFLTVVCVVFALAAFSQALQGSCVCVRGRRSVLAVAHWTNKMFTPTSVGLTSYPTLFFPFNIYTNIEEV